MDATFYDRRVAEKVPTSDNPEMTSLVSRIARWCAVTDGTRVLDFGCYDGYVLRKLRERSVIHGVGIDISPAAVELAGRIDSGSDLEFAACPDLPLPYRSGSFDVVVCSEILEHVPDLGRVLDEVSRLLAPGGRLYATMPNSLNEVSRPFRDLCRRIDIVEGHVRRMSRAEFLATVESHGFVTKRARYRGFLLSAIWYGNLIYSPRVKAFGLGLIGARKSYAERLATHVAHGAMWAYILGDRPFSRFHGSLSIDAAFVKSRGFAKASA